MFLNPDSEASNHSGLHQPRCAVQDIFVHNHILVLQGTFAVFQRHCNIHENSAVHRFGRDGSALKLLQE
jgi:hypothetical protein